MSRQRENLGHVGAGLRQRNLGLGVTACLSFVVFELSFPQTEWPCRLKHPVPILWKGRKRPEQPRKHFWKMTSSLRYVLGAREAYFFGIHEEAVL